MLNDNIPAHIAIIMDGNGRWATAKGLPRSAGHKKGAENIETITNAAKNMGVKYLTVFAFSTENIKRPKAEVDGLIKLMDAYIKNERKKKYKDVRLKFLGDLSMLPQSMQQDIERLENETSHIGDFTFNIAFNYGGRLDILQAAKSLAAMYKAGKINDLASVDEDDFAKLLYTKDQSYVDLLIRTGGEMRVSNFLIWQSAYAEFVFSPILWPDFSSQDLQEAVAVFQKRNRRLGGI